MTGERVPESPVATAGLRGAIVAAAICVLAVSACGGASDSVEEGSVVRVAVAANFADPHARLAERFTDRTGIAVRTSVGSTGRLYAQIVNGAPFDVLLAADTTRPERLEREGHAVRGSRFTYAEGRLVLYAPGVEAGPDALREAADPVIGEGRRLAIANPRLAPYGEAARRVLETLGLAEALADRIVMAENVGQAFQFVESGAAELGLVAGSYVLDAPPADVWTVPADLHGPIRQDAVRIDAAGDAAAVRAYVEHLRGEESRALIAAHGYGLPSAATDSARGGREPTPSGS